jgi:Fur family transcriptional regulator, ferric uptake regulator
MSYSQTIIANLRQRGYRITSQRELIIRAIAQGDLHLSAEDVLGELQEQTQAINLATIYRTLEMLWAEGFVYRNDLSEGKTVYTTLDHGPHAHLVCRKCKRVIDAAPEILQQLHEQALIRYAFEVDLAHLSLFGLCAACKDLV